MKTSAQKTLRSQEVETKFRSQGNAKGRSCVWAQKDAWGVKRSVGQESRHPNFYARIIIGMEKGRLRGQREKERMIEKITSE